MMTGPAQEITVKRPQRKTRQDRSVNERVRRAGARFARLVRIMAALRSSRGCPWDRKQSHETLRPFLLEEAHELIETIDRGEFDKLPGELGDVLFQCVFHGQIAAEAGRGDVSVAIEAITEKLIRRHPHVFTASGRLLPRGTRRLRTSAAVLEQWEQIKAREQASVGAKKRILSGVPRAMPALVRAHEIGTRVAAVGFDWPAAADVVLKVEEEVREFKAALTTDRAHLVEEFGDLLFSLTNLARKLEIDAESALRLANDKFTRRFEAIETELERRGRTVHETSTDDLNALWDLAKKTHSAM